MPEISTGTGSKGRTTFRIASVLFLLSAVLEIAAISTAAPLLGVFRSGLAAALYHLFYTALYLALAVGLWRASRWSYRLVFAATAIYTLDKLQYIIYRQSIFNELMRQAGGYRQLLQMVDRQLLLQAMVLMAVLFTACWWGFAIFTYLRRDYFLTVNPN